MHLYQTVTMRKPTHLLARYMQQQDGAAMVMGVFMMLTMLAALGSAIDIARANIVQARLVASLDAAGLAAGRVTNSENIQEVAEKYFYANFNQLNESTNVVTLTATASENNDKLYLEATVDVPTIIMQIFDYDKVSMRVETEVTRTSKGMELVLVIDNTGSMGGGGKLTAAKNASKDLINTLYGSKTTVDNLWIGIVPFAQAVNIGPSRASWTQGDSFDWGTQSWMGCVDARAASGRDVTDDPPSDELLAKYYWPDDSNNDWIRYSWYSGSYYSINSSRGPNENCSLEVTELTSSKTRLIDAIDAMWADGVTHINLGAVWGWRMLSPRWRGLWGGQMATDGLPLDYDEPLLTKVMILLSDGDNIIHNSARGAYWYLNNGRLGTTNQNNAQHELDDRTEDVCDAMKQEGIIIYTIAFGNPGNKAEALLEACASTSDFYFDSPTNEALEQAFNEIGDSLANLHISK